MIASPQGAGARAPAQSGALAAHSEGNALPRPAAIKTAIDPLRFYAAELTDAPTLKPGADGWTQNVRCPFHEEKTGSFGVNATTGAFRCFGCNAQGGSVLDFIMLRDGLTLTEARRDLGERYRVSSFSQGTGGTQGTALKDKAVSGSPRAEIPGNQREPPRPSLQAIPAKALATRPQRFRDLGAPSSSWQYRDPDGRPLAYICRFDRPDGSKEFRPQTWTEADGWQWKAPPAPRPLYRLDELTARPTVPVLFTEGEKDATAAARLLPHMVATTTMNGAQSPRNTDFAPLAGRVVRIWPDHDEPGAQYARTVAELAYAAGVLSVAVLDLASLAEDLPKGWGAADAVAEGWTAERLSGAKSGRVSAILTLIRRYQAG